MQPSGKKFTEFSHNILISATYLASKCGIMCHPFLCRYAKRRASVTAGRSLDVMLPWACPPFLRSFFWSPLRASQDRHAETYRYLIIRYENHTVRFGVAHEQNQTFCIFFPHLDFYTFCCFLNHSFTFWRVRQGICRKKGTIFFANLPKRG